MAVMVVVDLCEGLWVLQGVLTGAQGVPSGSWVAPMGAHLGA